jgi:hypothetical protein
MPGASRWRAALAAIAAALVVLAVVIFRPRPPREPQVNLAPGMPAAPKEEAAPTFAHRADPSGLVQSDKAAAETDEERYRQRMTETKKALLQKTRYPIGSQPLVTKTDLLHAHHVEPTMRGLSGDPGKPHNILITENQDRVWISPGQSAVASITATDNQAPAQLTISRSDLVVQIEDDAGHVSAGPTVGHPVFLDDGNPPDQLSGDGIYTAMVVVPPDTTPGAVVLSVDATGADGEQGTLLFNFVATAPPPAVFTQTATDALEDGSIAIYVGISVQQPGRYEIAGRLYDSTGMPLVYMRFMGELTTASTTVRLLAFGKVILDEGGVPPFNMQEVEGAEILIGQYPDRAPMADWVGPYALTGGYALSQLSDADYNGEDKQRKIAALNQAAKEGLDNIRASAPPPAPATTLVH